MKGKGRNRKRLIRLVTFPFTALCKARDFYVRSMTDCSGRVGVGNVAGVGPMHGGRLPKNFSVGSLRSNESDDFRELVRASSSTNGVRSADLDLLARERMKRAASDPGGMPRSCSVGMGKIDEDAPFVSGEDNGFGGSIVKSLPGFEGPLPFHLETGYIGVGESEEVQLFYYFIKTESNPEEDPLFLWISGGPGCSSWFGVVYDIVKFCKCRKQNLRRAAMKGKGRNRKRLIRLVTFPFTALCKARDFYVRSMTDCSGRVGVGNVAGVGPMHGGRLPKNFSVGSLRSNESDDFRELVRASSSTNGVRSADLDLLARERMKRAASDPGGMPRSCSVGMGKIDEDAPFVSGEDNGFGGSIVKSLPGFEGPLPFHLETGYIGVGESEEVQLFYYFIKTESNPEEDPLFLWISGGPGCSSWFGVVYDIGPLSVDAVDYNGSLPTLSLNPFSWTKVANFIFLDLPVGTGFSYATTPQANSSDSLQAANHGYQFIQKWLDLHPEFVSNPFYVSGDSYSGITVPMITQVISDGIEAGITRINLKGYLLGNPFTTPDNDDYQVPFAHNMGLIPDELYESLVRNCKGKYQDVNDQNSQCLKDTETFNQLISGIYTSHILEPICLDDSDSAKLTKSYGLRRSVTETFKRLRNPTLLPSVKCRINNDYCRMIGIIYVSIGLMIRVSDKPYMFESGDHDMMVPTIATEAWIKTLNYSIVDEWRQWMVEGQVAGYTRTYSNGMTFATVKGTGHIPPEWKPLECLAMFKRWIAYEAL
nr:serine carboxypeptidase-like 2 isoform X1 [Ipomoea batatas]